MKFIAKKGLVIREIENNSKVLVVNVDENDSYGAIDIGIFINERYTHDVFLGFLVEGNKITYYKHNGENELYILKGGRASGRGYFFEQAKNKLEQRNKQK